MRDVRRTPQTRDIVVIAVTARTLTRELDAARTAGCDAVICKSFDINGARRRGAERVLTHGVAALDVPGLSLGARRWPSGRSDVVQS